MKKLSKFIIIAAVAVSGCSKSYFDINQNPNSPSNASVDLVLANAIKTSAGFQVTTFATVSEWMNYWAPSGSYALNSSDGASYKQTTDFGDAIWTAFYRNLEDYQYVEQAATANNQYFYIAAAKTMKAMMFQHLVDLFNNVPYTEALAGTANLLPKYDKGIDIYTDLSTQLGAAVTLFQRADALAVIGEDVLFGTPTGTSAASENPQWARFANTLRLRILIRQTQVAGRTAYIQTEINKIVANGSGFLTTDAAVNPGYSNSAGKQNPLWGFAINVSGSYIQDFWRAGKYIIDFCNAHNDPRLTRWYAPAASGGAYAGSVVGSTLNLPGNKLSTFGPGVLKSVSQPAVILSAAESYFLQSEAYLKTFLVGPAGSAQTAFNNGVQASFTFLGAGSSAAYTSQADKQTNYGACTTDAERLACIIRQKFLAMNFVTPLEGWNDYRRLGLPADIPLSIHPNLDVPGTIPTRFQYPTSEFQTNLANVSGEGTINYHTSKIFWAQ